MYCRQEEGNGLLSLQQTLSGYGYKFAFPDHHASANSTICGLIKIFCHNYGIPHNISFHQGTCFTAKEVRGL